MIDLRYPKLPNSVCVGGTEFEIITDFRVWIDFSSRIEKDGELDYAYISMFFVGPPPPPQLSDEALLALFNFCSCSASTPSGTTGEEQSANVLDLIEDGPYIYASFVQCYGIDITTENLHWFKFKALLSSIVDTKLNQIMQIRSWKPEGKRSKTQSDADSRKLRSQWALKAKYRAETEEEKEAKAEFDNYFG